MSKQNYFLNKIIYKNGENKMDAAQSKIADGLTRLEIAINNNSDKISDFNTDINNQLFTLNERLERLTYSIEDLFRAYNDWKENNKRK